MIGIRSTAILFGRHDRLVIGALQAGALAGLALVGWLTLARPLVLGGLAVAAAARRARAVRLIRHREPAACFRAFLNNNLFGLAVFAGIALDYVFRG